MITMQTISADAIGFSRWGSGSGSAGRWRRDAQEESIGLGRWGGEAQHGSSTAEHREHRAEQGSRIQDGNISYANIEVGNYNGWIPLTTLERI